MEPCRANLCAVILTNKWCLATVEPNVGRSCCKYVQGMRPGQLGSFGIAWSGHGRSRCDTLERRNVEILIGEWLCRTRKMNRKKPSSTCAKTARRMMTAAGPRLVLHHQWHPGYRVCGLEDLGTNNVVCTCPHSFKTNKVPCGYVSGKRYTAGTQACLTSGKSRLKLPTDPLKMEDPKWYSTGWWSSSVFACFLKSSF